MSGICGAWLFDSDETLTPILERAVDALVYRGPDGCSTWSSAGVGFGQTTLATTPEALTEKMPFRDEATGCVIVADARLDNREELLAELSLNGGSYVMGDGELILRSFLEWGAACPSYLLGDFAFAIFDTARQEIFCARDQMGMRQLIYSHNLGISFSFASTAEALLHIGFVEKAINETRIADFLANLEDADFNSTFYQGILRLPPAHTLRVSNAGLQLAKYWSPAAQPVLDLPSDEAYTEAFLAVFEKAVSVRLRATGPVGAMLSGGTDSNAIAVTASRLLKKDGRILRTFSAIGPDPKTCIETRLIRSAIEHGKFEATTVDYSSLGDLAPALLETTLASLEPFDGTSTLNRSMYRAAQLQGLKILLDGASADVVLSGGNRIASLIAEREIITALEEACLESKNHGGSPSGRLLAAAGVILVPKIARKWRRRLGNWLHGYRVFPSFGKMRPTFEARTKHVARRRQSKSSFSGASFGPEYLAHVLSTPILAVARERYDRIASQFAIEPRDPFMDLRVINFCLSLPADQLQTGGFKKAILRRMLDGTVPNEIAWRRERTHLGPFFLEAVNSTAELPVRPDGAVPVALQQYIEGPEGKDPHFLRWSRYEWECLSTWLKRNQCQSSSNTTST